MSPQVKAALIRLDPLVDRAEYNALLRTKDLAAPFEDPKELAPFLRSLNETGYTALAERLENLGVLDWQIWAGDRTPATDIIAERPAATVLDLGSFTDREEQLAVALGVLSDLWGRREERRPVLLVVDEAHNLCSPDLESVAGRAVRDLIISIAAEGRKYGLWLLISTQRPGKVHRGIVSQCDNLTLMRMNSPDDLDELAHLFGFVPREMLGQSSRFRQGEALLAGGFVPAPSMIRVRDRLTQEGGIDVRVPMPE
jgi:DNA helicase HerA-like ATPase